MTSDEVASRRLAAWRKRIGSDALSDEELAARIDRHMAECAPLVWVQLRLPFVHAVCARPGWAWPWFLYVDDCPLIVSPQPGARRESVWL